MKAFIGVDPGESGAIAVLTPNSRATPITFAFRGQNAHEIVRFLKQVDPDCYCCLEEVSARGSAAGVQSAKSMFTFGLWYGRAEMALAAIGIANSKVAPHRWQNRFSLTRKRANETKVQKKNRHKSVAQDMFPQIKVTHATADALLIAVYCKELCTRGGNHG